MRYDPLCLWALPCWFSVRQFGLIISPLGYLLQDRPCTRCIKRNIGHLCHDESRETLNRKAKGEPDRTALEDEPSKNEFGQGPQLPALALGPKSGSSFLQDENIGLRPSSQEEVPSGSNDPTTRGQVSDSITQPREFTHPGWLSWN